MTKKQLGIIVLLCTTLIMFSVLIPMTLNAVGGTTILWLADLLSVIAFAVPIAWSAVGLVWIFKK